jgi:citrate lyase subunit beta/citryl-CoA lyase
MKLRRSVLFVPGSESEERQRHIISTCDADLICLDLEDTVTPEAKPAARARIAKLLTEDIWGRSDRAVRINSVGSPYARDDIVEVLTGSRCRVDTLICCKVDSDWHVTWIDELITKVAQDLGVDEQIKLSVGIESARALTEIDRLAAASHRIESLGFAIGDLSISLGVRVSEFLKDRSLYPGDLYHYVRSRINLAAKANGLQTLDGPWPVINDHATLEQDALWGSMLGMDGKVALSVEQVPVIHRAYRPSDSEVEYAHRTLELYRRCQSEGQGWGVADGVFLDQVLIGQAEATMRRAAAPV